MKLKFKQNDFEEEVDIPEGMERTFCLDNIPLLKYTVINDFLTVTLINDGKNYKNDIIFNFSEAITDKDKKELYKMLYNQGYRI